MIIIRAPVNEVLLERDAAQVSMSVKWQLYCSTFSLKCNGKPDNEGEVFSLLQCIVSLGLVKSHSGPNWLK